MEEVRRKFLQDNDGNESSKRLWGAILLATGVCMAVFLMTAGLAYGWISEMSATNILGSLFLSGAGLLGIGVVEKFTKK